MILTHKPFVSANPQKRTLFLVHVRHVDGIHIERWRTHLSAMNCALAIARTSRCATEEERCNKS